jgi:hypothetical protein
MSYSRNFGMRSFENVVRDGRFRVPKTGTPMLIGSPVQVDFAAAGYLKQAAAAAVKSPTCGVLVFEHIQFKGVDTALVTQYDTPFNQVPLGQYAQIVHGAGAKVWFKNTADKTMYDGATQAGSSLLTTTDLEVGDFLVPAADGTWVASADGATDGWLQVEQYNPTTGLVEARFTF